MKTLKSGLLKRILCGMIAAILVIACGTAAFADEEYMDLSSYAGKRIGIQTGTIFVERAPEYIENPEIYHFTSDNDAYMALKNGRLDGIVSDEPVLRFMAKSSDDFAVGRIKAEPDYIGIVAAQDENGQKIVNEINEYLAKIKENGEFDKLNERWFMSEEDIDPIPYEDIPDINGELVIATNAAYAPFQYVKNGIITGYETELVIMFCKAYGYKPVFNDVNFDGIIAGVTTGKYDIGVSGFTITEERKKSVLFTDPDYEQYPGFGYLKNVRTDVLTGIKNGFTRTFIDEDRWEMFVGGGLITMKITVWSIIFGSILGFLVHELYRRKYRIAKYFVDFFEWLINGMPVVVLLMIIYYIILGKSKLGGSDVAVVCFTLLFASGVRQMLELGESTIDPGQAMAARALGYTDSQTNLKIILPQSIRYMLPSYISSISSHIKATAVVGYIAVVDLTKVGDIVRGATYEAFFPLIAVAVLYFILADILKIIVKLIANGTDLKRRTEEQILKGAKIR